MTTPACSGNQTALSTSLVVISESVEVTMIKNAFARAVVAVWMMRWKALIATITSHLTTVIKTFNHACAGLDAVAPLSQRRGIHAQHSPYGPQTRRKRRHE